MNAKYNMTNAAVELSEKIELSKLEALENFMLDEVTVGSVDDEEGQASWMTMEDFRNFCKEVPNESAPPFTLDFIYGNGAFAVEVTDGKFDKIFFDADLEEEAEDLDELKELLSELGVQEPELEM